MIAPEHASKLLDEVIYERVLSCIDLAALFRFELDLWVAMHECGVGEARARDVAKQMIENALRRLPDDPRRYIDVQCELCDEERVS